MRRVLNSARQTSKRPVISSGRRGVIIGLVCLLVLVACGGDGSGVEEDRRYATDPGDPTTESMLTATAAVTIQATAVATVEPTIPSVQITPESSPEPVASTVETVYAIVDGAVIAVDVRTGQTRVIARSRDDERVMRVAASPDGGAVAIVWRLEDGDDRRYDLDVRDRTGEPVARWSDVESVLDPVQEPGNGRVAIDWSSQGGKIAVTFPDGGAILVPVTGDPVTLLTRRQAPAPMSIEWSPAGDAIAFTSRDPDSASAYLAIASVQALPVDPVIISGTDGKLPILDLGWLPGGSAVLAVQGSTDAADQVGGDLIQVDRRTLSARFSIGANRFGPSAEIVTVEAAPDGRHWAIVTVAPDARGGLTAAVWLVTPDLSSVMRIGLPDDPPVAGVTWTVQGLSITLFDPDRVHLITVDLAGNVVPVEEPPAASPIASPDPGAAPVASPVGSPVAPPIAIPDPEMLDESAATPFASPEASPATEADD